MSASRDAYKETTPGGGSAYPQKVAPARHQISELITHRWSPRAFDEALPVERRKTLALLEAARWAPSCFNEQPWRYLVFDSSNMDALERARSCLVEFNSWARKAPLLLLSVARDKFGNGTPNKHAQHDLGQASANLVLEAVHQGLVAHQIGGFDAARARREFSIPEGYTPMAMIAIGYAYRGALDHFPGMLRSMELQPRDRKPISEFAFSGKWSASLNE
jgi:nitroreductase